MIYISEQRYLTKLTRDNILEELMNNYNELREKISNGRVKNPENEKIKIQQYKILISLLRAINDIMKDKEVSEIKEDIKNLKQAINSTPIVVKENHSDKLDELAIKIGV